MWISKNCTKTVLTLTPWFLDSLIHWEKASRIHIRLREYTKKKKGKTQERWYILVFFLKGKWGFESLVSNDNKYKWVWEMWMQSFVVFVKSGAKKSGHHYFSSLKKWRKGEKKKRFWIDNFILTAIGWTALELEREHIPSFIPLSKVKKAS